MLEVFIADMVRRGHAVEFSEFDGWYCIKLTRDGQHLVRGGGSFEQASEQIRTDRLRVFGVAPAPGDATGGTP